MVGRKGEGVNVAVRRALDGAPVLAILGSMNATVTLDADGRVVLPQGLREELHLNAGDALTLETEGERIILRPVQANGSMRKERGVWVFRTGEPLDPSVVDETLDRVRQERDAANEGGTP
jgi:AbrB family looped-hinge helix DNA binding protein